MQRSLPAGPMNVRLILWTSAEISINGWLPVDGPIPAGRSAMLDVTQILAAIEQGDSGASDQLLVVVYEELRKLAKARLAQEQPGQTLQATALVHEAWLRLVGRSEGPTNWNGRGHFFGAAAEAMRRILIEQARRKDRLKHGGHLKQVEIAEIAMPASEHHVDLLDLNEALSKLETHEPSIAQLVKLRYFAGLSIEESADAMQISPATAKRYWAYARAWLYGQLRREEPTTSEFSPNS